MKSIGDYSRNAGMSNDKLSIASNAITSVQGSEGVDQATLILTREINLWGTQLKRFLKPKAAIFAVVENNRLKKMNLVNIVNHLKAIKVYEETSEVHYLPSPQFIFVSFDSEEAVLRFKELSFEIDNKKTVFITGDEKRSSCNIFINSLPMNVIESSVVPLLEKWCNITKIVPTTMPKMNGSKCNVGQIKIQVIFKEDCTIDSLPYFIRVLNCKVYLHVPGKAKISFRCGQSDHLIKECDKSYCSLCRCLKVKAHLCLLSYAQIKN